ncbi:YesL family protein [Bacillus sp. FSL K6-3431]|uniref:YesL family protein n=1 Tax=Bacillus sp. FSL K6-3431 TaxID=2921500 RepID=UPI0030F581E5
MNIFSLDSGFYRFLERFTNFILLNLLWIIMCIPIITIFPATAAMFGVVRQWVQKKDDGVFRNFFSFFKENFLQSFLIGIVWMILAFILYYNINISLHMTGALKIIMISSFLFFSLFFIMTTIFLFPVMVHYKMRLTVLLKNSVLISISQLWITLLCGIILLLAALVSKVIPISSIIVWSIAVYFVYYFCQKSFMKIEHIAQTNS